MAGCLHIRHVPQAPQQAGQTERDSSMGDAILNGVGWPSAPVGSVPHPLAARWGGPPQQHTGREGLELPSWRPAADRGGLPRWVGLVVIRARRQRACPQSFQLYWIPCPALSDTLDFDECSLGLLNACVLSDHLQSKMAAALPRAPFFADLHPSLPYIPPSPRLPVLKFAVPRLSVCSPLLRAGGSRGSLAQLHRRSQVPEQGPSTASLPVSLSLPRPWLSVRSQAPPLPLCPRASHSCQYTAQAGWRIGSE